MKLVSVTEKTVEKMRKFAKLNKFITWQGFTMPKLQTIDLDATNAKPKAYADMPGPRGIGGLGTFYNYLPVIGKYSWTALHEAGMQKYLRYGSIVRETIVPGHDIVWLFDPNDIDILLNERAYPQRRSHLALAKYRHDRPHIYSSAGLLPTNGVQWWNLRSEVQKEISAPKKVRSFLPHMNEVAKDFMDYLPKNICFDMLPKLARYNLELSFLLTFNTRLQAFSKPEQDLNARSTRLIRAAEQTNSSILPTDNGLQLWRYFETPAYKRLKQAQQYMEEVTLDFIKRYGNASQDSFVGAFLRNTKLKHNDIVSMAMDLILAGIDTTSYTMAFALYHVSRNQHVQDLLHEEACRLLANANSDILVEDLHNGVPYTRAVLKEVLRLNPISVGVGRILNQQLVLGGYAVPKDVVVVTQNLVACRLEENFPNALKFLPERWLDRQHQTHPYLLMPFGHGMRACLARRLSEQNIITLLLRLIRNFEIVWMGGNIPMDIRTLLINKPSRPVQILLKKRN